MEKPIPDFAIFQNSRTRVSALWIKEQGEWTRCPEADYAPINLMADVLRKSPDPHATLMQMAKVIAQLGEE